MTPTATIVIPAHDEEQWIAPAIESALAGQTIADVLVVDDGSTDRTAEIARSYERVTVVPCVGQGIVDVNNTGLTAATAEIVIHLDADDRLLPGAVEAFVDAFTDPEVVIAGGSTVVDDGTTAIDSKILFPSHRHLAVAAAAINPFSHTGTALRRAPVLSLGGYRSDGDVPWGEDYDLWLRILASGAKAAGVTQVVASKTLRPGGITAVHHEQQHGRMRSARARYRAGAERPGFAELVALGQELRANTPAEELRRRWSAVLAMLAMQLLGDGRPTDAAVVSAAAIRLGPVRLASGVIDHRRRMRRRRQVRTS